MNLYGKAVRIITTHPNSAHNMFMIPLGGRYQITSTHSTIQTFFITAYDGTTFIPVTINGTVSPRVVASAKPVSQLFYIPLGESLLLTLNTLDTKSEGRS